MADGLVRIESKSLTEAIGEVKQAERQLVKAQRTGHRRVAGRVAEWAQSDARSGTRAQARFAGAIKGTATNKAARLRLANGRRWAGAAATFWGTKRRTGWYANARYRRSTGRQHPEWVGANWRGGNRGEGPYVINNTVADKAPQISDLYGAAYQQAFDDTFKGRP